MNTRWLSGVRPMRLLFPALLVAPPLLVWLAIRRLAAPPALAMTLAALSVIALVFALERRWPFRADWAERPAFETRTDLVYIALASLPDRATRVAVEAAVLGALGVCCAAPPSEGGATMFARAIAAFLLADLAKYATHRASHERPWLWRFHLAHHQPRRLDALNALRLHPVNIAYNAAFDAAAIVLFRVPPAAAAALATLRAVVGVLQHANLDLDGQRQWLFNAPSYHRTHHAVDVREANHNYASTLLVWDRLFGTLLRRPAPAQVGVAGTSPLPEGYAGQLLHPLCGETLQSTCVWARFRSLVR